MSKNINSNNAFYKDLDTNFQLAYNMSEKIFSHDELIEMLKNGNIPEKQIAALNFDFVKNEDDAYALLNNLIGCDGKIREAVAFKINSIINDDENARRIFSDISAETFAAATIDINANICRLIVNCSFLLIDYKNFSVNYTKHIVGYILEALEELDKFVYKDKKYAINKQLFKLYWSLEALCQFYIYINDRTLNDILEKCSIQSEYTIREKAGEIIANSFKFETIREKLINDENYYVRQSLHTT